MNEIEIRGGQNETWKATFTEPSGAASDISDMTFSLVAGSRTIPCAATITGAGEVTFHMTPAQTDSLPARSTVWIKQTNQTDTYFDGPIVLVSV